MGQIVGKGSERGRKEMFIQHILFTVIWHQAHDSKREEGLLFLISSKVFLYAPSHRQHNTRTTAFVTPVMEHWLE